MKDRTPRAEFAGTARIDFDPTERIPFNRPVLTGAEQLYLDEVFERHEYAGGGYFAARCGSWLENTLSANLCLATTSCTHALEAAALLCDLKPGDEVILPSYAFTSTATAFARCGASLVFVDVEPETMNLDPALVKEAIGPRTRVLVPLHYAGVSCDMKELGKLAQENDLVVVEDAAHALLSTYEGRQCGGMGTFGCMSFHESKNLHCGEGGALIVNDESFRGRAEIVVEKGTNRSRFFRGEVDKYTWQDIGSSFLLSELNSAFLYAQLERAAEITADRKATWDLYFELLQPLVASGHLELPWVPEACQHNGHMFWIKVESYDVRSRLIAFLESRAISSVFHYVPLHSSVAGLRFGSFAGVDRHTTSGSERLLRLPLFYGFREAERVVETIDAFFARGESIASEK